MKSRETAKAGGKWQAVRKTRLVLQLSSVLHFVPFNNELLRLWFLVSNKWIMLCEVKASDKQVNKIKEKYCNRSLYLLHIYCKKFSSCSMFFLLCTCVLSNQNFFNENVTHRDCQCNYLSFTYCWPGAVAVGGINETRSVWPYNSGGEDEIPHKIYSNMKNFPSPN